MWIDRLVSSRTMHALQLTAQFTEQRQRVLAENLANVDTPDYHSKQLDPEAFQASLGEALERARTGRSRSLELRGNAQFANRGVNGVQVVPDRESAPNVLFHDGTNARMESLLSDVTSNNLLYDLSMNLLRGRFKSLLGAIKGKVE
jgi:flagellar basal-body rod protein FlgB